MYSARYALREGLPTVRPNEKPHRARVLPSELMSMSVREAAAVLGVPKSTIHDWRKRGRQGIRLAPLELLEFIRKTSAR